MIFDSQVHLDLIDNLSSFNAIQQQAMSMRALRIGIGTRTVSSLTVVTEAKRLKIGACE